MRVRLRDIILFGCMSLVSLAIPAGIIFHIWAVGTMGGKPRGARLIHDSVHAEDCSLNTLHRIEPYLMKYDNFKFFGFKLYYPDIENETETFKSSCMAESDETA